MNYRLIALDMDGTLLDHQKQISPGSITAIQKAAKEGKIIVLSTGRNPAELQPYLEQLPQVRYLNCLSGALVYDLQTQQTISSRTMPVEVVKQLFAIAKQEDAMPHILTHRSFVQRDHVVDMSCYFLEAYQEFFQWSTEKVDDISSWYHEAPFEPSKFIIYHTSPEAAERTIMRICQAKLPVSLARAERANVEISPQDTDKGYGLEQLCRHLNLSLAETIAVGDGENDLQVLQKAGLAVAMGNAIDAVKQIAQVQVADCGHDGCAEAIWNYLL